MKTHNTEITGWIGNADQMAAYAGCSKRQITRYIADKKLKVRHLSKRKIVCLPKDIDQCLMAVADAYEMGAE